MNLQTLETARNSAGPTGAIAALLRHLIDYAGLFPPASLAMASSVARYDADSRSEWNWILGRFIVPVARLGEFEAAQEQLPPATPGTAFAPWRLSALLGPDAVADMARIRQFNARMASSGKAVIEAVEVKVAHPAEIRQLSEFIPAQLTAYFEIPLTGRGECVAALAECGRGAKIRTGGEAADKFPASASVIEFMRLCAARNVPFKATAGLHHALRSLHRLTYQGDSPSGMMHGFINVFLAAAFLRAGMDAALATPLLEEQSATAFQFAADAVSWRQHRLTRDQIAAARVDFAISFGSCSFMEPIDDLRAMHLL